jgi:hypothetical protein
LHTISVSPLRANSSASRKAGRSATAPDNCSVKILPHPASARASRCKGKRGIDSAHHHRNLRRLGSSVRYFESEINASISWVWDGGINVELGDPLNGFDANDKVSTFAEATAWLRDLACKHYPDSEFAGKYGGFVWGAADLSAGRLKTKTVVSAAPFVIASRVGCRA